jgi:23S rRNA (cytosine1962-C5)-methyltransferase
MNSGGLLFVAFVARITSIRVLCLQSRSAADLSDANRTGRILASTGAAKDHPVHPALPETPISKAQLLQVD